jgi:hypothetical protein
MNYFRKVRARYREVKAAEAHERICAIEYAKVNGRPVHTVDGYQQFSKAYDKWVKAHNRAQYGIRWIYYLTGLSLETSTGSY